MSMPPVEHEPPPIIGAGFGRRSTFLPGDRQAMYADLVRDQHEENQARRDLVLRHPDIAARLTKYPFRYPQPEDWNGYMPPEMWRGARNDSPYRALLVRMLDDAENAERDAE